MPFQIRYTCDLLMPACLLASPAVALPNMARTCSTTASGYFAFGLPRPRNRAALAALNRRRCAHAIRPSAAVAFIIVDRVPVNKCFGLQHAALSQYDSTT